MVILKHHFGPEETHSPIKRVRFPPSAKRPSGSQDDLGLTPSSGSYMLLNSYLYFLTYKTDIEVNFNSL